MRIKSCEHTNLKILQKSNVLQMDYNGYPVRLCICECEDCGCTDQFWLDESLEKAKEELKNGTSVLLEWDDEKRQKGWICPRCNKVNAPFVKECDCNDDSNYTNGIPRILFTSVIEECNHSICEHEYVIEKTKVIDKYNSIMYCKCQKCGHLKKIHNKKLLIY